MKTKACIDMDSLKAADEDSKGIYIETVLAVL